MEVRRISNLCQEHRAGSWAICFSLFCLADMGSRRLGCPGITHMYLGTGLRLKAEEWAAGREGLLLPWPFEPHVAV